MTCIVGIAEGGKVYIGGDSTAAGGYALTVRADRKVFRNGDFVMGFTTSFRMGQLLHHSFSPPKRHPDTGVDKFMVTDFVNAVRQCLKDGGYAERHNEAERGGVFLVGYQVGEAADSFDAVGCGGQIAQGALFANPAGPPRERLRIALEAAEHFSAGVRGPFHFEEGGGV